MNSLSAATALVPAPAVRRQESTQASQVVQTFIDNLTTMSLSDLLATLVLPKDEKEYASNLVGVVQHFRKPAVPPLKEITTGVVETFREMQELEQGAEDHHDEGLHLFKRIAKWGFTKIAKFVFRLAFRMMVSFARWVFKRIIVNGIKALVEWVVRPLLMEILGFIGVNPELWPFVAIAGGVVALGFGAWKLFFDKPDAAEAAKAAQIKATRELAAEGVRQVPQVDTKTTTAEKGRSLVQQKREEAKVRAAQQEAAPKPAGEPVAIPTGDVDQLALTMLKRHEGYKTKPYKDSLGLWTIGIGHLIGDGKSLPPEWNREFSDQEVLAIFAKDYAVHKNAALKIPGFDKLNAIWQAALIDITFNMGPVWWKSWKIFQKQLLDGDLAGALDNLANSLWAKQTKSRATDILGMLRQDLANREQTTVTSDTQVKQTPAVTTAQAAPPSAPPPSTSSGGRQQVASNNTNRTFIKGPKGSIVPVTG